MHARSAFHEPLTPHPDPLPIESGEGENLHASGSWIQRAKIPFGEISPRPGFNIIAVLVLGKGEG